MEKSCKTCKHSTSFESCYHTPQICQTCLNATASTTDPVGSIHYRNWQPKEVSRTCNNCKHKYELCSKPDTALCNNWKLDGSTVIPKEEDSLKGEFYKDGELYVKLVCKTLNKEVEVAEIKLTDFVDKTITDTVDSICKTLKMK